MDAVISDIHGNLEALDAVLAEIVRAGADRIICLGDLCGYGSESNECLRRSGSWEIVIAGEWDRAMIEHDPSEWPPSLNARIEWTRKQIQSSPDAESLFDRICAYRKSFSENGWHFTHGTPSNLREYIFPEDIHFPIKLQRIADQFDSVLVSGQSHFPGIFLQRADTEWEFVVPIAGMSYEFSHDQKVIVTVGSVGQPRDGDARASWMTIAEGAVTFHRTDYDAALPVR